MKTKLLFATGFLIISIATFGQEEDSTPAIGTTNTEVNNNSIATDETTIDQFAKLKEKIKSISEKIENADKEKIADLKIMETANIYTEGTTDNKKIDSVYMVINDGVIRIIEVYANGKKFTNLRCPIGLTLRRFEKNADKLRAVGDENKYIKLPEVIKMNNWEQYIPDDVTVTYPRKDKNTIPLYRNIGINTIFDIRLYSDALALFGQEKNGLAQTDLKFKQVIHRSNYPNFPIFFLQYFNINFSYAKFDSKDEYINAASFSNSDLLRKQFVNAEVALNLMNGYLGYKSLNKYYLDAGAGIGLNKLVKPANDSVSITHTNIFLEAGTNFKFASNGGVNLNVRAIKLFSPSTDTYSDQFLQTTYFNHLKYGAEIYWNPKGDRANRLFIRGNYIEPTNSIYKRDGFFQVQVGYSLLLSELINKK